MLMPEEHFPASLGCLALIASLGRDGPWGRVGLLRLLLLLSASQNHTSSLEYILPDGLLLFLK